MTAAALTAAVLAVLVAVVLGRAYRVASRKVQRRDAELTLTREACDRQTVKVRHLQEQVVSYRCEAARLSARNAEMRDQLDAATGANTEPSLTEEFLAWLAEEPVTFPEDLR